MSQTDSFTTNHSGHSRLAGPRRSTQDANNTHNTSRYYLCQTAYSDDDGNASSSSLEDVSPIKGLYEENTSHCQYSLDQSSSLPQRREVSYGGPTPMNPPLTLVPHLATNDNAPLRHQTSAGEPESVLIDSQISNRLNESWNDVAKQLYQMP
ncbi:hypothetical protein AGDE_12939 [Angomonas deanei]|uniref:Uncharacterized protein n=1 Tax=Angomonas deanei TaxID=59799 RepID=A0A7G2CFX7_9TRYP|nr:hypothetical protein AGDE_12939 [Angomonas deanei]CAD2218740.1 hypothetical protein, conserved [Angomonas deanei]|eukprot:EPY23224.1 hypothetical protein AGDE_12939 [Angomonas deanei]